jgi:asparagine synthase (glutamine-hydrolysing)
MCGIIARIDLVTSQPLNLRALRDRGPDDHSIESFGRVTLGHTRLAVIDQHTSARQPLIGGASALICNGEILNHRELRASASQYSYRSSSDCEAVLDVYARAGIAGFSLLDGFYSFVLYDKQQQRVILHRDPVGKKPLFYASHNGLFVCASNVTAILDNSTLPRVADAEQVQHYWHHGYVHPARTIVEGIQPVLPGEVVIIDLQTNAITRQRVEKPMLALDHVDFSSDQDIGKNFDAALHTAVQKRMQGLDTPVLLFSGGLDSTVLAEEMLGFNRRTKLVTLNQPFPWLNDAPHARYAAKRLDAKLIHVWPWKDLRSAVENALSKLDQPFAAPSFLLMSVLSSHARRYGNVLFVGDGADEVLFGYQHAKHWFANGTSALQPKLRVGPEFRFPLSEYGWRQGTVDLMGHGFAKVDKSTAENGMEARCPFVDWDLMSFVRQIPLAYWQRNGGRPKTLLRRHLTSRGYSQAFVDRKKVGSGFPFRYLLAPHLGEINHFIQQNAEFLTALGAPLSALPTSVLNSFTAFDATWKAYVLARCAKELRLEPGSRSPSPANRVVGGTIKAIQSPFIAH